MQSLFDGFLEKTFTASFLGSSDGTVHIFPVPTSHFINGKKKLVPSFRNYNHILGG